MWRSGKTPGAASRQSRKDTWLVATRVLINRMVGSPSSFSPFYSFFLLKHFIPRCGGCVHLNKLLCHCCSTLGSYPWLEPGTGFFFNFFLFSFLILIFSTERLYPAARAIIFVLQQCALKSALSSYRLDCATHCKSKRVEPRTLNRREDISSLNGTKWTTYMK